MKHLILIGLISASAAVAQEVAVVVNVQPRYVTVQQQQCTQVPVREDNSGVGTVLGAVAGGIIGNQVGKGSGRDVATVGGAVIGGMVGNRIGSDQINSGVRHHCTYVPVTVQQGKTVTFNYQGQVFSHHFDRN